MIDLVTISRDWHRLSMLLLLDAGCTLYTSTYTHKIFIVCAVALFCWAAICSLPE